MVSVSGSLNVSQLVILGQISMHQSGLILWLVWAAATENANCAFHWDTFRYCFGYSEKI